MGNGRDQNKQYFLEHDDEFSSYSPSLLIVVDLIASNILSPIFMYVYPLEIVENFSNSENRRFGRIRWNGKHKKKTKTAFKL